MRDARSRATLGIHADPCKSQGERRQGPPVGWKRPARQRRAPPSWEFEGGARQHRAGAALGTRSRRKQSRSRPASERWERGGGRPSTGWLWPSLDLRETLTSQALAAGTVTQTAEDRSIVGLGDDPLSSASLRTRIADRSSSRLGFIECEPEGHAVGITGTAWPWLVSILCG
jgi:hypothetical protein